MGKCPVFLAGTVWAIVWACTSPVARPPTPTRLVAHNSPPNIILIVRAGPTASASIHSALLTGLSPALLGLEPLDPDRNALNSTLSPEVRVFPELLRRGGYFTVRRGPPRHNLSVIAAADGELAQPGLLGVWDVVGAGANWRRTLGERCTVSWGCGHVLFEVVPGQENTVEPDEPFFMLVNGEPSLGDSTADVDHLFTQLEADGLIDDTIVLEVDLAAAVGPVIGVWREHAADATASDTPVSAIDVAPTVLALAGVPIPSYMSGRIAVAPDAASTRSKEAGESRLESSVDRMSWGDGSPPVAAAPTGRPAGGLFHVAPYVRLRCDTEGSVIVYTTELDPPFYWRLYRGPLLMRFWTLRVRCGRLGYLDSDVVTYEFDIE